MKPWVVAALMLLGTRAGAEPADGAKAHFDQGTTLYDLGQYREAAHEYEEAFKRKPAPALLFNIGQAYRFAGDKAAAMRAYRSYLRRSPRAANRAEVEEYIARLKEPPKVEPPPVVEKPAPPPVVVAPPPAVVAPPPAVTVVAPPVRAERRPAYKKWWVWTIVGGVAAAGIGVGLGLGLTLKPEVAIPPGAHQVQF